MDQTNFPVGSLPPSRSGGKIIKITLITLLVVIIAWGIFYFFAQNKKGVQSLDTSGSSLLGSYNIIANQSSEDRMKFRDARRIADIASIRVMLELYFGDHNSYPQSLQVLERSSNDPLTNQPYFYARCGTKSYHLGANLERGNINYLQVDNDKGPMCSADKIDGADNKGCDGTNWLFCYDLAL